MTYQDLLDSWEWLTDSNMSGLSDETLTEVKMITDLIRKQIPKKPQIKNIKTVIQGYENSDDCLFCPLCNKFIGNKSYPDSANRFKYCSDCGQALDWGDYND